MSDEVMTSIIAAVGVVLAALITSQSRKIRDIQAQVTNDHSTNLRDDLDKTHRLVESLETSLERVQTGQNRVIKDMSGMRRDIGRVEDRDLERGRELRAVAQKLDAHLEWSARHRRD